MTKKTKQIFIGVGILVVVIAIVYFIKKKPNADNKEIGNSASLFIDEDRLLKRGDVGSDVESLQRGYNNYEAIPKGLTKLVEDGQFGAKTEAAIYTATGRKQIRLSQFNNLYN